MADTEQVSNEIRQYLLGRVSGEDQNRIEELIVTDALYFERVELIEDDLIEAYVDGDLSEVERESYERYFLSTPERRRRVDMSRALKRVLVETQSATTRPGRLLPFLSRYRMTGRNVAVAASVGICVIFLAYSISYLSRFRAEANNREQRWRQEVAVRDLKIQRLEDELRRERSKPLPESDSPKSGDTVPVLSFLLFPNIVMRGNYADRPASLVVSKRSPVHLRLVIDAEENVRQSAGLRAVLSNANGQQVWSADSPITIVGRPQPTISLKIPPGILAPGQYRLRVYTKDHGKAEELETYSFSVVPR